MTRSDRSRLSRKAAELSERAANGDSKAAETARRIMKILADDRRLVVG